MDTMVRHAHGFSGVSQIRFVMTLYIALKSGGSCAKGTIIDRDGIPDWYIGYFQGVSGIKSAVRTSEIAFDVERFSDARWRDIAKESQIELAILTQPDEIADAQQSETAYVAVEDIPFVTVIPIGVSLLIWLVIHALNAHEGRHQFWEYASSFAGCTMTMLASIYLFGGSTRR